MPPNQGADRDTGTGCPEHPRRSARTTSGQIDSYRCPTGAAGLLASCRRWSTVRGPLFLRGRTPLDRVTPWGLDRARSYRVGAHKQPYAEAGRPSAPRRALFGPGDTPAHCTGCGMSGCSYIRQQPLSCSREVRLTYPTPRVRARPRTPTYIFPALLAVSRSANRPLFFTPGAPRPLLRSRSQGCVPREPVWCAETGARRRAGESRPEDYPLEAA